MAVPAAESAHESEPNGTANSHISEPVKELRPLIPLQSEEVIVPSIHYIICRILQNDELIPNY